MTDDRFFVKSLTLENFRCFEKIELGPFDPNFNLLVGENGAGKSSVLLALESLFRQIATPNLVDPGDSFTRPSDIRSVERVGVDGVRYLHFPYSGAIRASLQFGATEFTAAEAIGVRNSDQNGHLREIVKAVSPPSQFYQLGVGPQGYVSDSPLLLIISYTTQRHFRGLTLHSDASSGLPARLSAMENWREAGFDSTKLVEWLKNKTLADLQRSEIERSRRAEHDVADSFSQLRLVRHAVVEAVERADKIEFDADRNDIVVQYEDGDRKAFSSMSDGQRALIGLVADIARRACLLNAPFLGARTLRETSGLVLIDEIDLHLHPRWQRRVIADLKRIFPKIQFFATTHSPQIIGEARPEEIVLLTPTGQKRPMQSFGMDSNWVLECVMEAEGRDPEVAKKIAAMFEAIEHERFDEARRLIAELRDTLGEAPDVVAAESYLWNLEHDAGEAAE